MRSSTTLLQLQQRHKPGCLTRCTQRPATHMAACSSDPQINYTSTLIQLKVIVTSCIHTPIECSRSAHTDADKQGKMQRVAFSVASNDCWTVVAALSLCLLHGISTSVYIPKCPWQAHASTQMQQTSNSTGFAQISLADLPSCKGLTKAQHGRCRPSSPLAVSLITPSAGGDSASRLYSCHHSCALPLKPVDASMSRRASASV